MIFDKNNTRKEREIRRIKHFIEKEISSHKGKIDKIGEISKEPRKKILRRIFHAEKKPPVNVEKLMATGWKVLGEINVADYFLKETGDYRSRLTATSKSLVKYLGDDFPVDGIKLLYIPQDKPEVIISKKRIRKEILNYVDRSIKRIKNCTDKIHEDTDTVDEDDQPKKIPYVSDKIKMLLIHRAELYMAIDDAEELRPYNSDINRARRLIKASLGEDYTFSLIDFYGSILDE